MYFRGCVAATYWVVWLYDSVYQFIHVGFFALQYFTIWGMWLTTFYFTFTFVSQLRFRKRQRASLMSPSSADLQHKVAGLADSESPWHVWKWASMLFTTALLWECIIASIYWTILYPTDRKNRLLGHPWAQFFNVFDHAVPVICLWLDWCLNCVWIEWNHLYPNLAVILVYGFVNMAVTFGSGTPVYAPLSWDSFWAWVMGLAVFPIAVGFYFGIYYATKWKFRR